jgi:hypothetical protein
LPFFRGEELLKREMEEKKKSTFFRKLLSLSPIVQTSVAALASWADQMLSAGSRNSGVPPG